MRLALVLAACLLSGCNQRQHHGQLRTYRVTITRPDGVVHKQFSISSSEKPWMTTYNGIMRVAYRHPNTVGYYVTQPAPVGWMMDVDVRAESDSP